MRFFVTDHERTGPCYYEFYKGRWDGETFWKKDSLFLEDPVLFQAVGFETALVECVPGYDPFGEMEITRGEWARMGKALASKDAFSQALYNEAAPWADEVFTVYGCFSILGL